ncbi:MAG: acyl-CoA dehydratase activase-related protein, partial [Planctomycetota bacterium]
ISLQDGIVVDFTMNEACAAGTGSFLQERADELEIPIKGEFARLAMSSKAPISLGERCTVFMERDVNTCLQRGASKADLVAGLAYSVAYNYINRVVRGRPIGETVFFQGGTAYNDAVAAAFSAVTGKQIVVPPYNGVIGAIGAALLAMEKMQGADDATAGITGTYVSETTGQIASRFRGFDVSQVDYALREFMCKGCANACQIQEFTVEGEKTYWGDKCSDRYRKRAKSAGKPVIDDLFALRARLLDDVSAFPPVPPEAPMVGIPRTMFAIEQLPFWQTLLAHCGLRSVVSEPTNKAICQAGLDSVVAEPCFPIIVGHGHVMALAKRDDVDYVLVPNIVTSASPAPGKERFLCPWHTTLPLVVRQAPALREHVGKLLTPAVYFSDGPEAVVRSLLPALGPLGVSRRRLRGAVTAAYEAQEAFHAAFFAAGRQAMAVLAESGAPGVVLIGRPYNLHDAGVNLSVAGKLRDYYGVNVVPLDALDTADVDISDINDNMFWEMGRRCIAGARIVGQHANLHVIYITNFKCGPDSFVKHFIRPASGKPFLTLQFDGHSNDAGMMTRCEAYLDSKGIIRRRAGKTPAAANV